MERTKVFVSGCFDMLHSGHVAFFEEAASHGDLYVGLGSDENIYNLKSRKTINSQEERLYMVKALRFVKEAWVNKGNGILDFTDEIISLQPDIFFVNEDGHTQEKKAFCKTHHIQYLVSKRQPKGSLPRRSTTALRHEITIPYRIDLAGGWLDQPYVSKLAAGPVVTISIEPDYEFNHRAGMATSTRNKALELWGNAIPKGDNEQLAKILFSYENPPGSKYISGSQDSLGIVMPGINHLWYDREQYWPTEVKQNHSEETLSWLEQRISLMALPPRPHELSVTDGATFIAASAIKLSMAASALWKSINDRDAKAVGMHMKAAFDAQIELFPNMLPEHIRQSIESVSDQTLGYKLSGAGGGGYLVLFSEKEIPGTLKIRIRRAEN